MSGSSFHTEASLEVEGLRRPSPESQAWLGARNRNGHQWLAQQLSDEKVDADDVRAAIAEFCECEDETLRPLAEALEAELMVALDAWVASDRIYRQLRAGAACCPGSGQGHPAPDRGG